VVKLRRGGLSGPFSLEDGGWAGNNTNDAVNTACRLDDIRYALVIVEECYLKDILLPSAKH
jgi:hypothetical protein